MKEKEELTDTPHSSIHPVEVLVGMIDSESVRPLYLYRGGVVDQTPPV